MNALLQHLSPETAGAHLVTSIMRATPDQSAGVVRTALVDRTLQDTHLICVVDAQDHLLGILTFANLFRLPTERLMGEAMQPHPPTVRPDEDQEKVASIALHHGLASVPVTDAEDRLLGLVPTQALLHILRHEHVEDLHRLAGIKRETTVARHAMDAPPLRRARDRLPWLIVGLIGSALATYVMSQFEAALNEKLALAFFIPALVYLADAIGTQTEAVTVRGLSLSHVGIARLLGGEVRTGLIIGLVLGGMTFPVVWWVFGEVRLALAVGGSLFVAGGLATSIGLLFPWVLSRMHLDPAFGSGPIATVLQDVLTLLTYFAIVSLLY
ncbi:MAG: magnesium transporter [Pseudomonadota bacterium]